MVFFRTKQRRGYPLYFYSSCILLPEMKFVGQCQTRRGWHGSAHAAQRHHSPGSKSTTSASCLFASVERISLINLDKLVTVVSMKTLHEGWVPRVISAMVCL